jgi:NTE family protein
MQHPGKLLILLFLLVHSTVTTAQPFKNLVLEGGGIRGIAYAGAVGVLDSSGVLKNIENIAGTSAGALQGMAIAVGYSSAEMREILENVKWEHLNDGALIFVGGSLRMVQYYGWFPGMALRNWCDDMLFAKTGIHDLTFRQLDSLKKTHKEMKNLYVVASNLTIQQPMELSVRTFPNMCIADAINASAAIPLYYEPVVIDRNGKRLAKGQGDSNSYYLVDGGLLANYPYFIFDSMPGRTLGLMLDRPAQINRTDSGHAEFPINNILDFTEACYTSVLEMQTHRIWNPVMEKNTVRISVGNIGPRVRKMKKEEVDMLVNNGRIATLGFLESQLLKKK